MPYNYDELYAKHANALGEPFKQVVTFFEALDRPHTVLDIGCGQGRDALFIARLGHTVTGVDLSPAGIKQLDAAAKSENLPITGVVADIESYQPEGQFDILLIDRTLHMLTDDSQEEVLKKLLTALKPSGYLLLIDEVSNMARLKDAAHAIKWTTLLEQGGYWFAQLGNSNH